MPLNTLLKIHLLAFMPTQQGKYVHIEIGDKGIGIPEGQEEFIFNKFSRAKKESSIPGVGLGLAICQAIIELHDGVIWVRIIKKLD